jgi:hypothetical protein
VCESDEIHALNLVHFGFANLIALHPKTEKRMVNVVKGEYPSENAPAHR